MRILLLDDSLDNLNLLKLYVKKSSDEFVMVSDADEALTKINEEHFDMFFLDIQMPLKDGFEVLKDVRESEKAKDLFVCALTAHTSKNEVEKINKSSFNDYLQKPILRNEFLEYIEKFSIKAAG
ncbi:response regulator [Halobacteriovorax sp.]|uniref:response regulator n=1 Tax=Halobacteriovorax sp. TaxID=2020862 RepID=UPI003562E681